jgi:hypothetical protein
MIGIHRQVRREERMPWMLEEWRPRSRWHGRGDGRNSRRNYTRVSGLIDSHRSLRPMKFKTGVSVLHTQGRTQVELSGGIGPHSKIWISVVFVQILDKNFQILQNLGKECPHSIDLPPLISFSGSATVHTHWSLRTKWSAGQKSIQPKAHVPLVCVNYPFLVFPYI